MGIRSVLNRILRSSRVPDSGDSAGLILPEALAWPRITTATPASPNRLAVHPKALLPDSSVSHCLVLLDRSPSMLMQDWPPNRLEAAKEAVLAYSRRLALGQPQPRLGIVVFCGLVHTLCDFQPAGQTEFFASALSTVETEVSTNIGDALNVAHRMLICVSGPCHVLLVTDGDHNTGPEPLPLVGPLKAIARVETVGVGRRSNINEPLLRAIASANPDGSVAYRWIGSKEDLQTHMKETADRICRR